MAECWVYVSQNAYTVYPKKYAHGFVMLCFVVVMQSFIMNSHEVFIHIHQGCFAGTGAIVRLPQCQWSKPDGYGKISQCITTTKHSKAKTVCIFLGIYCILACLSFLNTRTAQVLEIFPRERQGRFVSHRQYHWWPGDVSNLVISNHDIYLVCLEYFGRSTRMVCSARNAIDKHVMN